MHRGALFSILFISCLSFFPFSQEPEIKYEGNDDYLRMCVLWRDSTKYELADTIENRIIYTFKVQKLYWGVYRESEIYIMVHSIQIDQFNPTRELGRAYYWTMKKSEYEIQGRPVYSARGNF